VHELENQLSTFQEQQIYNEKIRHQEKADQPEGQPESVSQLSKMSRLKTWHPIDQGRLLWWLFLAPQQLKAYRQQYGIKAEQSVGKWLSSTLTWLPLFLLVMGLRLQTLPSVGLDNNSFYWLGSGIVFSWLITGNWGDSERIIITGAALVFAVVVAVIIGFSVAESVLTSVAAGIMIGIMAVVMAGIANFVTGVVAGGGASGVPIGVAGGLVTGVAVGVVSHVSSVNVSIVGVVIVTFVAAIVAFILWFAVVAIGNYVMLRFWPVEDETINALSYIVAVAGFAVTGGVVADVMGLSVVTFVMIGGAVGVTVITVIGMQIILAGIIKDGQPSWLLKGGGGALVGAYLFLVWFSFLSGYRAF
jgi:hypothetical protein